MSKHARTSGQADIEQPSSFTLMLHTSIVMSRSIVVERDIKLVDFYDLTFEGRTLPEVVEEIGWLPLIHSTGYASRNLVQKFYCAILQATDIEEPSMELTVHNVSIVFSLDELARFFGYERDLTTFLNLPMSDEGRLTKAEVFQTMLGDDSVILDRAYMVHGQLRPFWQIMNLILCFVIDLRKYTTELSYNRAEFFYLLTERMQSVLRSTHEMVSDISCRLTTLEQKVMDMDMDSRWKKEIAAVQEAMRKAVTNVELFALTQGVVHIEEP
ncbi:hypothetical protein CJ030_MR8G020220 [Morella rubra]|uniref:Uncharacterized protein n=1 Tax=Morella rubra TaxID=262757 RepID=A0A6A1UP98_9ROSI|nr:hypothetical protein CJ030_MR8G020220 [Morella rubra]